MEYILVWYRSSNISHIIILVREVPALLCHTYPFFFNIWLVAFRGKMIMIISSLLENSIVCTVFVGYKFWGHSPPSSTYVVESYNWYRFRGPRDNKKMDFPPPS